MRGRALYGLYLVLTVLLLSEIGARVIFATRLGPRTLWYGTSWWRREVESEEEGRVRVVPDRTRDHVQGRRRWKQHEARLDTVESHENVVAGEGYSKYHPHEHKVHWDVDTGEVFPVTINEHGFRGEDYAIEKRPGVVRVVTLGASSTFGFYNRDDETYPHQLEEILARRCPNREFEVLNLGMPHSTSGQILALFRDEALPLRPDVVTFYQGRNDTHAEPPAKGWPARARDAVAERSLLVNWMVHLSGPDDEMVTHLGETFERDAAAIIEPYLEHVGAIRDECRRRDILFVVANQQSNSKTWFGRPAAERLALRGVTYQDEVDEILSQVDRGEPITQFQYKFLIHHRMMEQLEVWATRNEVPFADVIGRLDHDRHYLLTWVHLHPEANRMVAETLADQIEPRICLGSVGSVPP